MDPLSMSGFAIGAVSLTFQIFSGCVKAYQLLLDANGMPEKFQYLWVRLQMEQHKLLDWGWLANLSEDEHTILGTSIHLSRHTINDTLQQIQALLHDIAGLSKRYKLTLEADDAGGGGSSAAAASNGGVTASSGQAKMKAKALDLVAKSRKYPTRLRWAAFDREKFEALLKDLAALNESMAYFLESDQRRAAYQLQQSSFMQILQVSNKVDGLIDLVSSLEVSGGGRGSGSTDMTSAGAIAGPAARKVTDWETRLIKLARFKAVSVAVEQPSSNDDPRAVKLRKFTTDGLKLNVHDLKTLTGKEGEATESNVRTRFSYHGTAVWVEWKEYMSQGIDWLPPDYLGDRVRKLAAVLHYNEKPAEFRVPDCLGYVHQPDLERFGFVYCWPKEPMVDAGTSPTDTNPPISLHDLLLAIDCPPLGARIAVMRAVATAVWYLHATNWLHKGLRSENVVFRRSDSHQQQALGEPFLSGFEYSRPAEAGERTEKPMARSIYHELYRHPRVQFDLPRDGTAVGAAASGKKRGFRKIYDIYALGVVLLEVALWEPVHKLVIIKDPQAITPREARGTWTALAQERKYEGKLRAMVGDKVADAVVACITGNLVSEQEAEKDQGRLDMLLEAALGEKVVKILEDMKV